MEKVARIIVSRATSRPWSCVSVAIIFVLLWSFSGWFQPSLRDSSPFIRYTVTSSPPPPLFPYQMLRRSRHHSTSGLFLQAPPTYPTAQRRCASERTVNLPMVRVQNTSVFSWSCESCLSWSLTANICGHKSIQRNAFSPLPLPLPPPPTHTSLIPHIRDLKL